MQPPQNHILLSEVGCKTAPPRRLRSGSSSALSTVYTIHANLRYVFIK